MSFVSLGASLFFPGLILNAESTREEVLAFFRLEAIIVSVPFILLVILIREKPPTPPSKAAEA
jgi:hypothetical protein